MERFIRTLMVGLILVLATVVDAAYLIKLKNGNEFVTGRYWHEGTQLMFDVYGGIFGIDRAFVTKIEESNKTLKLESPVYEDVKDKPGTEQAQEAKKPKTSTGVKAEAERKDDPIIQEFNRLQETSRNIDGMSTSEIRDLLRDITSFKNKISRDSKLFIKYAREFNDAQEIGNVTENALTSRNQ